LSSVYRIFVGVIPGLEPLLLDELRSLVPARSAVTASGGVELAGPPRTLWAIALGSRLAETLRVRLGRGFDARTFDELVEHCRRQAWSAYLPRGGAMPRIQVTCKRSALYHSDAVAERIQALLAERLGSREPAGEARVHVRLNKDRCQISVDAAGEPLHRRGYRKHLSEAPLRETLAAAARAAAGYRAGQPLWDPFCGAGTIALEALGVATGAAPGLQRRFACEDWPVHDAGAFADLQAALPAPHAPLAPIIGSDRSADALDAARANARPLEHGDEIRWLLGDFAEVADKIPEGAAVVSNPPYGRRSRGRAGAPGRLGELLRRRPDLGPVVLLNGDADLPRQTGLRWRTLASLKNRGLPVRLLQLDR